MFPCAQVQVQFHDCYDNPHKNETLVTNKPMMNHLYKHFVSYLSCAGIMVQFASYVHV